MQDAAGGESTLSTQHSTWIPGAPGSTDKQGVHPYEPNLACARGYLCRVRLGSQEHQSQERNKKESNRKSATLLASEMSGNRKRLAATVRLSST